MRTLIGETMSQPPLQVVQLTPPGRGAVATLRIEGPGAVETVQSHFRARSGRPLAAYSTDQFVVGRFGGEQGEEVVARARATTPWNCIATADWRPWR